MVKLINVLIVFLFLLSVYFILTRIFGHSATDLTISITLIGVLGGMVYNNISKISNLNREVGEIKITMVNSFSKVKEDMGRIKEDISGIKQDIGEIKTIVKKR